MGADGARTGQAGVREAREGIREEPGRELDLKEGRIGKQAGEWGRDGVGGSALLTRAMTEVPTSFYPCGAHLQHFIQV